jgi:porin
MELFYRLQFSQNLAVTPSLQYISDPALNPAEDSLTIFGLRLRLTL